MIGWRTEAPSWHVLYGPDIAPGEPAAERASYRDVLLDERLRAAVARMNPQLPLEAVDAALAALRRAESTDVLAENWRVHRLVTQGVPVEYRDDAGGLRHDTARLVDFDEVETNDFVVVNQMTVEQDTNVRRPDVLAFVNGIPLGLLELKVPGQARASLSGAWRQLGNTR